MLCMIILTGLGAACRWRLLVGFATGVQVLPFCGAVGGVSITFTRRIGFVCSRTPGWGCITNREITYRPFRSLQIVLYK